ncbi:hypothetical protein C4K01_0352 [Pseudomonas synxantha]|nr:hypothetical protein C4K01_0352 [Pseudomonas synxantha]
MGAGLPAIAVYLRQMGWLEVRHRRQASSHIDFRQIQIFSG